MSYDPTIGRWVEEDPIGFKGGTPNLYDYVGNDPTNAVDPSGLAGYYSSNAERMAAVSAFGPGRAAKAKELADLALKTTQEKFPKASLHNDEADAWRHCFWSAMMAKEPALKPAYVVHAPANAFGPSGSLHNFTDFAYMVGYNHELYGDRAGQPLIEHAMDMHNNNVGLTIGRRLGPDASTEDVITACDKALKDGDLIWIEDGKLTKPAVYNDLAEAETKVLYLDLYTRPRYRKVTTDREGKVVEKGDVISPHDVVPFK